MIPLWTNRPFKDSTTSFVSTKGLKVSKHQVKILHLISFACFSLKLSKGNLSMITHARISRCSDSPTRTNVKMSQNPSRTSEPSNLKSPDWSCYPSVGCDHHFAALQLVHVQSANPCALWEKGSANCRIRELDAGKAPIQENDATAFQIAQPNITALKPRNSLNHESGNCDVTCVQIKFNIVQHLCPCLQITRLPNHQLILQTIQTLTMESARWIRICQPKMKEA